MPKGKKNELEPIVLDLLEKNPKGLTFLQLYELFPSFSPQAIRNAFYRLKKKSLTTILKDYVEAKKHHPDARILLRLSNEN